MLNITLKDSEVQILVSLLAQCTCGDAADGLYDKLTEHLGTYKGGTPLLTVELWNRATNEAKVINGKDDILLRVNSPAASREYY